MDGGTVEWCGMQVCLSQDCIIMDTGMKLAMLSGVDSSYEDLDGDAMWRT